MDDVFNDTSFFYEISDAVSSIAVIRESLWHILLHSES